MDTLNFDYKNLTVICVDRDKKSPGTIVETLKVDKVPTFIFYHKRNEVGRIIETPVNLFEKDMLENLSK